MKDVRFVFVTRSDISWYSKNANVYRKALEVVSLGEAALCVRTTCRVPPEIAAKAARVVRFGCVSELQALPLSPDARVFTGFDFPCMALAVRLVRETGCSWTLCCWDPPCLSHRDRFPPLRWAIDWLFRRFVNRCDHLVLNIHPGLLREVGFSWPAIARAAEAGRLELRMQDAFDGLSVETLPPVRDDDDCDYEVGVLSDWTRAKGGPLVAKALRAHPELRCLWVGGLPRRIESYRQIAFTGRLRQDEAFRRLRGCRVLLVPYLPVRSLKWNYVLKIFEYLPLGRRVLASDNPGNVAVAERFPGRVTLFRSGDAADLAAKLGELVRPHGDGSLLV